MDVAPEENDQRLAARLREERQRQGLSLEVLAERSGVSRAMISKIERGESSPTAALLGKLCAGLGLSLGSLFTQAPEPFRPLVRRADQPVWRDPGTGYLRRGVSPAGSGSPIEINEIFLPPAARVAFETPWLVRRIDQHIWLFAGELEITLGEELFRLGPGDCLHMRLDRPIRYFNPAAVEAHYAVILTLDAGAGGIR
jgi:transcriptional regulator with XRE-family HTH domain